MNYQLMDRATLLWSALLAFGFPGLLILLAEVIPVIRRRGWPIANALESLRHYVLPTLALYLFLSHVVGMPATDWPVRVSLTILWLFVINAALLLVNDVIFRGAREGSWQSRVPKLLIDIVRLVVVLTGAAVVLSKAWGMNIGSVVTALGVGSIVIGLALQEPLGNVFAGIMLLFERPLNEGDYVEVTGQVGRVAQINWRAVHLHSEDGDITVVPNGIVARSAFTNYSRPTRLHTVKVDLAFSCDDAPGRVKTVLAEVASSIPLVLRDPAPHVHLTAFTGANADYSVYLHVAGFEDADDARDEYLSRVWYAARREGLTTPGQLHWKSSAEEEKENVWKAADPETLIERFPQFTHVAREGDHAISLGAVVRLYSAGEDVFVEGQQVDGLYLVVSGTASLTARDAEGRTHLVDNVEAGGYFGEQSVLTGAPSMVTVTALEDLAVVELSRQTVQDLTSRSAHLATEMGRVMDARRALAASARRA